jgi:DNA invertase Pin-like site-specific DNA recombinase
MSRRPTPPEGAGPPAPAAGDGQGGAGAQKKYTRRAALYLRVSTDDQTTANQQRELEAVAARAGWQIVATFRDEGISGSKGRDRRPGLDAMLKGAVRREFDVIAAWSVDRLGRSLQDLVAMLSEIHAAGVDLYLHQQAIDTTTPAGKAMFQMMGVFAEFERSMIRERVKSGMARAKAQGKRLGKPAVSAAKEAAVRDELARGTGLVKAARLHGVGTYTAQRIKKEMTL